MNLKMNLRRILKEKDMTVAQLGRLTGIPKTTIAEWVAGGNPRDLNKLKTVAEKLETSIDELCFGVGIAKTNVTLKDFEEEIFAGNFDVILRKAKK